MTLRGQYFPPPQKVEVLIVLSIFVSWLLKSIYGQSKIILLIPKKQLYNKKYFLGLTQDYPYMVWERLHDQAAGAHISRWAAIECVCVWASLPAGIHPLIDRMKKIKTSIYEEFYPKMSRTLCYINVDFNHFHLFASLVVVRMSAYAVHPIQKYSGEVLFFHLSISSSCYLIRHLAKNNI